MEIRWNETPRRDWDAAMRGAAWSQNWAYGAAFAKGGLSVHRAAILDGGEVLGHAQFTARGFGGRVYAATCTRGPIWVQEPGAAVRRESYRALRRTIPLPRLRGVFFTPDAPAQEAATLKAARLSRVMSAYSTALLDLRAPEDALLQRMQGKWRNRLRRAEESGLVVTVAPAKPGSYDWLLEQEAAQQSHRRYRAFPPGFVSTWHGQAGPFDAVVLATARRGEERLGGMLFLVHGAGALYHIGVTSEAGRAANAHTLLLWRAVQALRKRGVEALDLGGVDTLDTPGIARFKLGSGAVVRTLCGTWC